MGNDEIKTTEVEVKDEQQGTFLQRVKAVSEKDPNKKRLHPLIKAVIILLVVVVVFLTAVLIITSSSTIMISLISAIMPESISIDIDGEEMEFYGELSEEYINSEEKVVDGTYVTAFDFYYYDEDGNQIYLDEGKYDYVDSEGEESTSNVRMTFYIQVIAVALGVFNIIKEVLIVVAVVLAVVAVVYGLYELYMYDRRRKKKRKALTSNRHGSSKKNANYKQLSDKKSKKKSKKNKGKKKK